MSISLSLLHSPKSLSFQGFSAFFRSFGASFQSEIYVHENGNERENKGKG
jgi:hypothetical protein